MRSGSPAEALEIYDVRAAIFGLAGRLLADLVNDQMLAKLSVSSTRWTRSRPARTSTINIPSTWHSTTISSPPPATTHWSGNTRVFVNKLHLARARGLVQAGGLSVSNREHREMVDALASGNREHAQEAFFRHVERSKMRFRSTLSSAESRS
ncbi:FCD domain-containing protein [Pseudorhizobium sp. NPDC055634]